MFYRSSRYWREIILNTYSTQFIFDQFCNIVSLDWILGETSLTSLANLLPSSLHEFMNMLACLYMSVSILNCYYCEFPVSTAPSSSQQQLLNKFEFIAVSENHSLTIWNSWYIMKTNLWHKLINTCYCLHAWTDSTIVFQQNKFISVWKIEWKAWIDC